MLLSLAMALEIPVPNGQYQSKGKRENRVSCLTGGGSLGLASWVEAISLDISCFSSLLIWCGGLQGFYRTRWQVEFSLAVVYIYISEPQYLLVLHQWQWSGWLSRQHSYWQLDYLLIYSFYIKSRYFGKKHEAGFLLLAFHSLAMSF